MVRDPRLGPARRRTTPSPSRARRACGLWTLFGRAERTENDELAGGHHGPAYRVGKVSLGAIRDFRVAPHVRLGLGGLYAFNFVPSALRAAYGGNPEGAMAFIRLKVD